MSPPDLGIFPDAARLFGIRTRRKRVGRRFAPEPERLWQVVPEERLGDAVPQVPVERELERLVERTDLVQNALVDEGGGAVDPARRPKSMPLSQEARPWRGGRDPTIFVTGSDHVVMKERHNVRGFR